jgi:hypothetical protein
MKEPNDLELSGPAKTHLHDRAELAGYRLSWRFCQGSSE